MALRNILTDGEPALQKKSREVTEFNQRLHTLLDDMTDTLLEVGGLGLAASQIGVLRRVCIVVDEVTDEETSEVDAEIIEIINPKISNRNGAEKLYEGCLSYPDMYGEIERPEAVTLKAFDRLGNEFTLEATGMLAREICHEVDHLDGVTIVDHCDKFYTGEQLSEMDEKAKK